MECEPAQRSCQRLGLGNGVRRESWANEGAPKYYSKNNERESKNDSPIDVIELVAWHLNINPGKWKLFYGLAKDPNRSLDCGNIRDMIHQVSCVPWTSLKIYGSILCELSENGKAGAEFLVLLH